MPNGYGLHSQSIFPQIRRRIFTACRQGQEEPVNHSLRTVQPSSTRFEPAALAPFSARVPTRGRLGGRLGAQRRQTSPVDVLAARYPVVHRLVGEESFRAIAHQFVAGGVFPDDGDAFPRFLRSRGDAASIEYVADIAELEMACAKARHAADARPVGAQAFSPVSIKRLKELRVELHPSVFLVASRFPIVTIWENNRGDGEPGMIARWRAEAALVARPFIEVEVRRLPRGGHAFIAALAAGRTMALAAEAGMAATSDFDVAANLLALIDAEIVVGFRESA
jgi:hypothetical protein